MAVLLQWHGLEKLHMFNIFTKLGIFSLLGCKFPTNGIRLRKRVLLLGNMLLRQYGSYAWDLHFVIQSCEVKA